MFKSLREFSQTVVTAAVIFIFLQLVTQTFRVVGPSMEPVLADGHHVLVNKLAYIDVANDRLVQFLPWVTVAHEVEKEYIFRGPESGDVIVFRPPDGSTADFVKRVIGIPGDVIDIRDGNVYVNGKKREDDPRTLRQGGLDYPAKVPNGHFFVLGDNRGQSHDSRAWSYVQADDIVGRVFFRYWPPIELKLF